MKLPGHLFNTPAMPIGDIVVWTRDPEVAARVVVRRHHGARFAHAGFSLLSGTRIYWVKREHFNDTALYEGQHVADASRVPVMPAKPQPRPEVMRPAAPAAMPVPSEDFRNSPWFTSLLSGYGIQI